MSENEFNKRQHEVMQRELAEAEANKQQLAIDRWWQSQRDLDFELNDWVTIGGFRERRSAMPSFHRGRRDSDWRAR
jgi:hypothetical protein